VFVFVRVVVFVRMRMPRAIRMGVVVGMLIVLVVVFVVLVAVGMLVRRAVGVLVRVGMLARCHATLLLVKYFGAHLRFTRPRDPQDSRPRLLSSMTQRQQADHDLDGDQYDHGQLQELRARILSLIGKEAIDLVDAAHFRIELTLPIP
jgi:hypothetical protein